MTRTEFSAVVDRARALVAHRQRAQLEERARLEERAAAAPAWLADLLAEDQDNAHGSL